MAASQLAERRKFKYPPFYRMIELQVQHKDEAVVSSAAAELADLLKEKLGNRILGPEFPIVSRIKNFYLKNILIKLERNENTQRLKEEVEKRIAAFETAGRHKAARIIVDVDPV
jgi:primosomal protein N' (replication factor Y) (superfamily II helicase)